MTTARNRSTRHAARPHPRASTGAGQNGRRSTSRGTGSHPSASRPRAARVLADRRRHARRRAAVLWSTGLLGLVGVITAAMVATGSGSLQSSTARPAPGFTLTATSGRPVSLASYRGHDVVLYFNEGAGCDACFYQMRQFEQHAAELTSAGITILPIVMNPAAQIRQELASFGLHTPYLIDATGSVSRAYGVLGKGMHAGLPGHGFVLIDTRGTQRWYGEYPSMYLTTTALLQQVRSHLGT
jgi:peroxiredoxin